MSCELRCTSQLQVRVLQRRCRTAEDVKSSTPSAVISRPTVLDFRRELFRTAPASGSMLSPPVTRYKPVNPEDTNHAPRPYTLRFRPAGSLWRTSLLKRSSHSATACRRLPQLR